MSERVRLDTATPEQLRAELMLGVEIMGANMCVKPQVGKYGIRSGIKCPLAMRQRTTGEDCLNCWLGVLLNVPVPGGERE